MYDQFVSRKQKRAHGAKQEEAAPVVWAEHFSLTVPVDVAHTHIVLALYDHVAYKRKMLVAYTVVPLAAVAAVAAPVRSEARRPPLSPGRAPPTSASAETDAAAEHVRTSPEGEGARGERKRLEFALHPTWAQRSSVASRFFRAVAGPHTEASSAYEPKLELSLAVHER
jgi:hypothetical protein